MGWLIIRKAVMTILLIGFVSTLYVFAFILLHCNGGSGRYGSNVLETYTFYAYGINSHNIPIILYKNKIINICNKKVLAYINDSIAKYISSLNNVKIFISKDFIVIYGKNSSYFFAIYYIPYKHVFIYKDNLFNMVNNTINRSGVIDFLPCISNLCSAFIRGSGVNVFVETIDIMSGKVRFKYLSNSVLLQEVNNSVVASLLDTKHNISIIYDLEKESILFTIPAIKALLPVGKPVIELVSINNRIYAYVLLVTQQGFSAFLVSPNSLFFNETNKVIVASRDLSFYIVREPNGLSSVVVFKDGYRFVIPYVLSISSLWGLRYHEPSEAVVYADPMYHSVLVRMYTGKGASIVLAMGSWDSRFVLYTSKNLSDIYGLYAVPCGHLAPEGGKVVVFDGDQAYVVKYYRSCSGSRIFSLRVIGVGLLSVFIVVAVLGYYRTRLVRNG